MAINHSPAAVLDNLVFFFDAGNVKSYPGTGAVCTDMIGNNAGDLVNSPTYSTTKGGALSFASDKYLKFPEKASLNTQTFSIEVWFRTNSLSQNGFFFEKGQVNTQYSLFQEGSTIVFRYRYSGGYSSKTISSTTNLNITDWFHLTATYVSGSQQVYVNGVSKLSATDVGTVITNTNGMSIGAYGGYNGGRSYYYNGDIAVVKVYDKVLSPEEVIQNYNALRGRFA